MRTRESNEIWLTIDPEDLREATAVFESVGSQIEQWLAGFASDRYEVETGSTTNTQKSLGDTFGFDAGDDASISQEFNVFEGWRRGAALQLFWAADDRKRLRVSVEPHCRLEDKAMGALLGVPGLLGVLAGFLMIGAPLLGALVGLVAGCIVGGAVYYLFGRPILHCFISGDDRRRSRELAGEVLAGAEQHLAAVSAAGIAEREKQEETT